MCVVSFYIDFRLFHSKDYGVKSIFFARANRRPGQRLGNLVHFWRYELLTAEMKLIVVF
jgi:hypothetical protein